MIGQRPLNYYTRPSFLKLDVKAGVLRSPAGTRMLVVNDDFLRGFVAACEHETGPAAALVLRRCGEHFGARLARRFEAEVGQLAGTSVRDLQMAEFDALVRDLWDGCGLGAVAVDWTRGEHGFLAISLRDSPMQDIGPSGHVGDEMFCGIFAGFFGEFCDADVRCVQTGDMRLGDPDGTTFIIAPFAIAKRIEGLRVNRMRHREIVEALAH
jgi:hypothetical protein